MKCIPLLASAGLLFSSLLPYCFGQAVPPPFNPESTWRARLHIGPPLYLPTHQRGIEFIHTYARCEGQHYLLQRLHYDAQGRLDTSVSYYLGEQQQKLHSQLSRRYIYQTQGSGDSLVSRAEYQLATQTGWYSGGYERFKGAIPPVEPLLGEGAQAQHLLLPPTGRLRRIPLAKNLDSTQNHSHWAWFTDSASHTGRLSYADYYAPNGYYGSDVELDYQARTLTATTGGGGGRLTYTRRYTGTSQDYVEKCHQSTVLIGAGGASMEGDVYVRTTHWSKGLCRTEHFTVLNQEPHPEFDVVHQYTFYTKKRAKQLSP
jgi:hypothetical protein